MDDDNNSSQEFQRSEYIGKAVASLFSSFVVPVFGLSNIESKLFAQWYYFTLYKILYFLKFSIKLCELILRPSRLEDKGRALVEEELFGKRNLFSEKSSFSSDKIVCK